MNPIHLVVIGNPATPSLRLLEPLREHHHVQIGETAAELTPAAADADAVLVATAKGDVLQALWPALNKLRWVHSLSAGVESVVIPELVASDTPLTNSRGVFKESLGEFAIAAILFFAKDLRRMVRNQEAHRWEQFDVDEIYKQTLAVVGYGEIGRAAARRAHALGMRVTAVRRRPELSANDEILTKAFPPEQRLQMIGEADYILAAAPLTPQTRGIIGYDEIAAMKPNAVLMNVGRGPVIDELALIGALQDGLIRGAALDVFDEEPLPEFHPFWRMDNVLLSPHTADHTTTWMDESVEFFLKNFKHYENAEPLENIVDKKAGY